MICDREGYHRTNCPWYSCGLWKQLNMPANGSRYSSTFSNLEDRNLNILKNAIEDIELNEETERSMVLLKQVYDICLDEDAVDEAGQQPLIKLMDKTLGHHMSPMDLILQRHIPSDGVPLETRIAKLWLDHGLQSLISLYIGQDEKNSSRYIIYLGTPLLGLGVDSHELYLSNDTDNEELMADYFKAMQEFNTLWKYGNLTHSLNEDEIFALKELLKFETTLAAASLVNGSLEEAQYNLVKFATLDSISSRFSLTLVMEEFPAVNEVNIFQPNFFSNIDSILEDTPDEIIHAYLAWLVLLDQFKFLGRDYRQLYYDYFENHEENCETCGRPYDCLEYIMGDISDSPGLGKGQLLREVCWVQFYTSFDASVAFVLLTIDHTILTIGMALGKLFITSSSFDDETVSSVDEMVNELVAGFKQIVTENGWMDDETKERTYEKIDAMRRVVGYPALMFNSLDEYYSPLLEDQHDFCGTVIYPTDGFLEINRKLTSWSFHADARKLVESPDFSLMEGSPAITNAWYMYSKNGMYIPAGIIQFPIFGKDVPPAVNFGALGTIMSHELTHALDDYGSGVDANGNLNTLWSESSTEKFYEKVKCMSDQYDDYCYIINDEEFCVDAEDTLSENIADSGSVMGSYIAYKNFVKDRQELLLPSFQDFTMEKIFFLSYGNLFCAAMSDEDLMDMLDYDEHAPMRDRVNGVLRNVDQFAITFNCPPGSPMNPVEKCVVW
ncbi:Endothelin-converting enzyme 1 [Trichuris trichiura]|uniref:Endothelin-converting enzyme 1 n=1 Tax=Trichuris trichiura TaxID=36087 RepID=A0A077ZK70_TRITR|nr:Endothelin-converting enzyme 1 [Trichuris trichiura]